MAKRRCKHVVHWSYDDPRGEGWAVQNDGRESYWVENTKFNTYRRVNVPALALKKGAQRALRLRAGVDARLSEICIDRKDSEYADLKKVYRPERG